MTPPRRMQSQTERDFDGLAARKEREAVPIEVDEECTGKYEGNDLADRRARRPTPERIARLETKHDKLDEKVDEIHGDVREMKGKLDIALSFITDQGKTQRTRISTNGKILIALITAAIGAISTVLVAVLS